MTIDTFSAHSLKILDKSIEEFKNKFIYNLSLFKKDPRATLGQKFHALICYYINNFDVSKLVEDLNEQEQIIWKNLENILQEKKKGFVKTEYPFLIKNELKGKNYYLTGRYDAIYRENNQYIIYDWKTLNLPKNPKEDLQSIVYLYCASKIFKTQNIKMRYLSIEKLDFVDVEFESCEKYKNKIDSIILKLKDCD
ncbi:MAG: PD-(D/E)XK nuclease family protein [Candidatus Gastranaerophilales bacterium]|nr:PD-(D/E)XK nuclease family protein [Candidatus Gastranaerophilales bacterium]